MSYHRGGYPGAVAVSYSTSTMAPLSPSRRYSGTTGSSTGSTSSTTGGTSSKYNTYRASSSIGSDRPSNYYPSSSNTGYRTSSFSDSYRRPHISPARSVSSYNESSSIVGSSSSVAGNGLRYGSASSSSASSTTSSTSSSASRERNGLLHTPAISSTTTAAELYAKYSPTNYVPNIYSSTSSSSAIGNGHWRPSSSSSSSGLSSSVLAELHGGDEYDSCRERRERSYSSEGSSGIGLSINNSNSGVSPGLAERWSTRREAKRRTTPTVQGIGGTVLAGHAHLDSAPAPTEDESSNSRPPRNRLQSRRDERYGLNGLRNIGNTCFMNSVIQCLSNTRPLLEYLLNEQHLHDINTTTSSMKGALIKAFGQVIHELWEMSGDHVVNTTALKSQIQRFAPRFMGYSQQDAQEFLRYLLEGLHEDVNRVTVKPQPILTDIPDHYSDSHKAAESWKRYLRSEDSTIVDVFVGQLRSSLHCTSCDHVSVTLDPFWDLSLPIPVRSGTVKLNQCLEHFTKVETLDGDEKPTCSKCQMRRKCTKSFSIQKFPKILVIHLKRFSPTERFRGKLSVLVDFPLMGLDLSAFAAPGVQGCTYNLYGVANHSGTTYSGHYTAYCKHPYSGDWHEYNDNRVSTVPARSVVSSEAYVLFYEQQPLSPHL